MLATANVMQWHTSNWRQGRAVIILRRSECQLALERQLTSAIFGITANKEPDFFMATNQSAVAAQQLVTTLPKSSGTFCRPISTLATVLRL